nr:glycosyltransferase family 2 protein [uncultured Bacteroides sp.]
MKDKLVSIITINYNGLQDTCELIESLQKYETYPYEIIVVDNASQGDDVDKLSNRKYPFVKLIRSDKNLGFAGGNNLGIKYAKGEYLFFLNNDMVVKSPVIENLVNRLCANPLIAGISPMIRFFYRPNEIQYYGYRDLSVISVMRRTEYFDISRMDEYLHAQKTEVLHGGAMMFHREAIEKVGVMTEVYFLFYEEFDWSRRFREAGYELWYDPASIVYHKESATIKPLTAFREFYLTRSRMIFTRRNNKRLVRILSCLYLIFISAPNKTQRYAREGNWHMIPSVWCGAFSGLLVKIH